MLKVSKKSDNKFVFSNREKYIVLQAGKICLVIFFHLYSPNIRLGKDRFSRQIQNDKLNTVIKVHDQAFSNYSK